VLLSGHHAQVAAWRRREALKRTRDRRPELLTPEHVAELARLDGILSGDQPNPA
jgi:tRNA (guanine37-N1)-methyltransferase